MATTKTLTPTNQTISIPELTDAPDMSVASDALGKEADAINALNTQIVTLITTEEKTIVVGSNVTISQRNGYYYGEYSLSNFANYSKIISVQVVAWSGTVGTCIIDGNNINVIYNASPSSGHWLKVRAIKLNV